MKPQEKILKRLDELHETGEQLKEYDPLLGGVDPYHWDKCQAWIVAVRSVLHLLFGTSSHPYKSEIESVCDDDLNQEIKYRVGHVTAILEHLISDLTNDMIFSIEDRTRAIVFEDFLDDAKSLVKSQAHRESSVLAAAVFEDAIRSISRKNGVLEEGVKTDQIITELTKKGVFSAVKAKRARSSSGVRNKAMHTEWEAFNLEDVKSLIHFTDELITLLDEN